MDWFNSFLYLVFISIIAFPIGRILPKNLMKYDRFPFTPFKWEKNGKIYNHLHVRKWMKKVPDMSRVMTKQMKRKELPGGFDDNDVKYLLDETCIAESVHTMLCIFGLYCIKLWKTKGGVIFWILYTVVFNLPYIIIQRYNRPRLARMHERILKDEASAETEPQENNAD